MNLFDRIKRLHLEAFVRGQAMVAHDKAAADFAASQSLTQEAAKAAVETINLANELAADNDPHKRELADAIKG